MILRLAISKWSGVRSDGFENALNVKQNGNSGFEAKYLYDARKPAMYLYHTSLFEPDAMFLEKAYC